MRNNTHTRLARLSTAALLAAALALGACGGDDKSDKAADEINAYQDVAIKTYRGVDRQVKPVSECISREGFQSQLGAYGTGGNPRKCIEPCRDCIGDIGTLKKRFVAAYKESPDDVRRLYSRSFALERDYLDASSRFMKFMLGIFRKGTMSPAEAKRGDRLADAADRLSARVPRAFDRDQDRAKDYLEDL